MNAFYEDNNLDKLVNTPIKLTVDIVSTYHHVQKLLKVLLTGIPSSFAELTTKEELINKEF